MIQEKVDNRRLVKILGISGIGILGIFIFIRFLYSGSGDNVVHMPSPGQLEYYPKQERQLTKSEEYVEQEKKIRQKESGIEDEKYIVPNFNEILSKKNTSITGDENKVGEKSIPINELGSSQVGDRNVPTPSNNFENLRNSDNLNYKSEYFTKSNENAIEPAETYSDTELRNSNPSIKGKEEITVPKVIKNPFNTITNFEDVKKDESASSTYFEAEIYGDQKIANDGLVMMRNTQNINTNSKRIPKNSILFGQAKFNGNRVQIHINRAKTANGEMLVDLLVLDNDRIEGIYYQTPVDDIAQKKKEDVEIELPGTYGKAISKVAETVIKGGKEIIKKSNTLNLREGYKLFIKINTSL